MANLNNWISNKVAEFRAERARTRALMAQLDKLTDYGLLDRLTAPESRILQEPEPVPVRRPARSLDGILRAV